MLQIIHLVLGSVTGAPNGNSLIGSLDEFLYYNRALSLVKFLLYMEEQLLTLKHQQAIQPNYLLFIQTQLHLY